MLFLPFSHFFVGVGIRLPENELRFSMSPPPMPISLFANRLRVSPLVVSSKC